MLDEKIGQIISHLDNYFMMIIFFKTLPFKLL